MNNPISCPLRRAAAILTAAALPCCAAWATWSIYRISYFRNGTGGEALRALTRSLGAFAPDFLAHLGYPTGDTRAVSLGLIILGLCGVALGVASRLNVLLLESVEAGAPGPHRFNPFIRSALFAAGIACLAVLLARVSDGKAVLRDALLWLGALCAVGMVVADRPLRRPAPLLDRAETAVLLAASAAAAAFYMGGAMWWVYSFCGDEYEYFNMATRLIGDPTINLFSQRGVGSGTIPLGISYAQAGVMKLLGADNFGWRASSAIFAALCFIPFYYYMRSFFSRMAAAASTALMACSFYLATWARMGKPHNHVNTFYCLALGCYAWFRHAPSRTRAYIGGAILGAGFYFFHSAKFAFLFFLIPCAVDLFRERALRKAEYAAAFAAGFLVAAAPCAVDPAITDVVAAVQKYAVARCAGPVSSAHPGRTPAYVARNSIQFFLCPFYYAWHDGGYIHRTLTDCLTAALTGLGIGWTLVWAFRRRQAAALLLTYGAAVVLIGGTIPYNYPAPTRALWAFPWWAAFAGIAVWRLLELGYAHSPGRRGIWCWCAALIAGAAALNLDQLWRIVPAEYDLISPNALVVKEVQAEPLGERAICLMGGDPDGVPEAFAIMAAQYYGFETRFRVLHNRDLAKGDFPASVARPALLVVDSRNTDAKRVCSDLERLFPRCRTKSEPAMGGGLTVHMFFIDREGEESVPPR